MYYATIVCSWLFDGWFNSVQFRVGCNVVVIAADTGRNHVILIVYKTYTLSVVVEPLTS
ncbi:hypothetical protein M5D96_000181 [Drosophila gunungcola]|uniref:Uncharacterized protein n=1 Tax=Drosophila gunungcola TaxID=103775 RepID=A0A9Q0BTH9_9MUSC|nr:hypothetical protein M5D96_000181 [Drosophila gunungcola]